MFKRIITCCLCTVFALCILSGCSKGNDNACTVEDVQTLLTRYLSQDYASCADNYIQASYNNMSTEEQQEIIALMQNVSIINVEAESDTSFKVTLSVPNAEDMLTSALSDNGFISDFENADLNADDNAHKVVVEKYLTSLLQQGSVRTAEKSFSVSVVGDEYQLETDLDIVRVLKEFIEFDGASFVVSQLNDEISTEVPQETKAEFTTVDSNKVFMFQQNGARFLVHDIQVLQKLDAVQSVQKLSAANVNISTNDNAYFIQYKIKNLSNSDVQVSDCFKLIDTNGALLKNSGAYITGLTQVGSVGAGEEIEFSTFLVGPSDARVVWYSAEDTLGCYILNIVQ